MLIYEKENKLNINFEDKIGDPDFSIYKNNEDKVVISSNGTTSEPGSSSGGGGGVMHVSVNVTESGDYEVHTLSKTYNEIKNAAESGIVVIDEQAQDEDNGTIYYNPVILSAYYYDTGNEMYTIEDSTHDYTTADPDGYPFYIGNDK